MPRYRDGVKMAKTEVVIDYMLPLPPGIQDNRFKMRPFVGVYYSITQMDFEMVKAAMADPSIPADIKKLWNDKIEYEAKTGKFGLYKIAFRKWGKQFVALSPWDFLSVAKMISPKKFEMDGKFVLLRVNILPSFTNWKTHEIKKLVDEGRVTTKHTLKELEARYREIKRHYHNSVVLWWIPSWHRDLHVTDSSVFGRMAVQTYEAAAYAKLAGPKVAAFPSMEALVDGVSEQMKNFDITSHNLRDDVRRVAVERDDVADQLKTAKTPIIVPETIMGLPSFAERPQAPVEQEKTFEFKVSRIGMVLSLAMVFVFAAVGFIGIYTYYLGTQALKPVYDASIALVGFVGAAIMTAITAFVYRRGLREPVALKEKARPREEQGMQQPPGEQQYTEGPPEEQGMGQQ